MEEEVRIADKEAILTEIGKKEMIIIEKKVITKEGGAKMIPLVITPLVMTRKAPTNRQNLATILRFPLMCYPRYIVAILRMNKGLSEASFRTCTQLVH